MGLKIGKKHSRKIKAIAIEAGDFGESKRHYFDVEFALLTRAEAKEITAMNEAQNEDGAHERILASIISLKGQLFTNENDEPIAVQDLKKETEEHPWAFNAILNAFWNVQSGISQAQYTAERLKN